MKKIILSTLIFLGCLLASAQDKYGTYHSSYFKKDYDVSASEKSIYVQIEGERKSDDVRFSINKEDVETFTGALLLVKEKFLEWKKIAKENNVTEMRKEFPFVFPTVTVAWYGSKWWFAFYHRPTATFLITKSGICTCVFSDIVKASSNEYIDQFYMLALSEASDFDSLMNILDVSKADAALNKKQNTEDLFK